MDSWSRKTLKALIVPGGILLLVAVVLLEGGLLSLSASTLNFYYYSVFIAGFWLALRFRFSRTLFALLTLLLAHRALEFFSAGEAAAAGPGHTALETVALLLPLNFIVLSLIRESGVTLPAIASRALLIFVESVFVAVLCRPGQNGGPAFLHLSFLGGQLVPHVSQLALLAFTGAFGILLARFLLLRQPVESGFLWSLAAAFLSLHAGGAGRNAAAYLATAGLILVSSIVENSYLLAYHDELTTLPARRAFNDALLQLEAPYAVAIVDIDHFKRFNDTYGHETGDQVLRMVAAKLGHTSGGGKAYRIGGEEFAILFPGKRAKEALPHLELMRSTVEESDFRVRAEVDRRGPSRGRNSETRDRRNKVRRIADHKATSAAGRSREAGMRGSFSVTISIGVAEPTAKKPACEQVVEAADKALYRAKRAGRNRLETASPQPGRSPRLTRHSIA